jgi:hypothetical protein
LRARLVRRSFVAATVDEEDPETALAALRTLAPSTTSAG